MTRLCDNVPTERTLSSGTVLTRNGRSMMINTSTQRNRQHDVNHRRLWPHCNLRYRLRSEDLASLLQRMSTMTLPRLPCANENQYVMTSGFNVISSGVDAEPQEPCACSILEHRQQSSPIMPAGLNQRPT